MKLLILIVVLSLSVQGDDVDDRTQNAVDVANAGMTACRDPNNNKPQRNTVPYLTNSSYLIKALGVIGGMLPYYKTKKMKDEIKSGFMELNQRFDQLEIDINSQFAQLKGYIDRKQFQTDIEDPTSILWGEMIAFIQYPNNETHANMQFECMRQTPWQIAIKMRNRFNGPDNSIMTQIQSDQWSNNSFMATKDVIMTKIFQLMTVQSFCVGVQRGPNIDITENWSIQRMYKIYSDIVNSIVSSRIAQERDYFQAVVPQLVESTVTDNNKNNFNSYAFNIQVTLTNKYTWDRFLVVVADNGCSHIGYHADVGSSGTGYSPYAVILKTHNKVDVYVIRYWINHDAPIDRENTYRNCMQSAYNNDPYQWGENVGCGQSYNVLNDNWYCGGNVKYEPSSTTKPDAYYAVSNVNYKDGYSSAVWPASTRMTTVEYDLGFWERPISITLMPVSN